jgi:hypothetical protein
VAHQADVSRLRGRCRHSPLNSERAPEGAHPCCQEVGEGVVQAGGVGC